MNDTTPALPTNADRTNGAPTASVAARSRSSSAGRDSPSFVVMAARKVLWAQCSLQVWASVSSSTSVGSRPLPDGEALHRVQLRGLEGETSLHAELGEAIPRDRSRSAMVSTTGRSGVPGWRSGSARPDVHSSMTGLATSLRSNRSMVSASVPCAASRRRPVAPHAPAPRADGRHGRRRPPSCR